MKKNMAAISIHLVLILLLNIVIGAFSGTVETEGSVKFTGELERNVTIRILENDTAVKQGYLKRLLDAFNEAYAEYSIVAVEANMDEYSDLENDGPYGYGPDVLYQANDRLMRYVDGKHMTVKLGVRPEHIVLEQGLKGIVDVSELMGSSVHLHVSAMDRDVVIVVSTMNMTGAEVSAPTNGASLSFSFPGHVCHVFDPETGINLEA